MRRSPQLLCSFRTLIIAALVWAATYSGAESSVNETYFMDGDDCNSELLVSGAVVRSHAPAAHPSPSVYRHNTECKIVFQAKRDGWRLQLMFDYLDIPDRTLGDLCTDAVYIYDSATVGSRAVKTAGGNAGLCGHNVPSLITSSGSHLTVYFRTDSSGVRGQGFRFVITAFHRGHASEDGGCGVNFKCRNERCIDSGLTCDGIGHCGDGSDEEAGGSSQCGPPTDANSTYSDNLWDKFISLGTTVCVLVAAAIVTALALLAVCMTCLCRSFRRRRKKAKHPTRQRRAAGNVPRFDAGRGDGIRGPDALLTPNRVQYDPCLPRQTAHADHSGQAFLAPVESAFIDGGSFHPAAAIMYHSFSTAAQAGSSTSYASHWQDGHESCSHSSGYSSQQTPASAASAALYFPPTSSASFYHQQLAHKPPTSQPWQYASATAGSNYSRAGAASPHHQSVTSAKLSLSDSGP